MIKVYPVMMREQKWNYISKKKIYAGYTLMIIIGTLVASLSFFSHLINPEKFSPDPFWDIIIFIIVILFLFILIIIIHFTQAKYLINSYILVIPFPKFKTTIFQDQIPKLNNFYKNIVKAIEMSLEKNKLPNKKEIERDVDGLLPFITSFTLKIRDIKIMIVRDKYDVSIRIGDLKPDQKFFAENELQKIIERSINDPKKQ